MDNIEVLRIDNPVPYTKNVNVTEKRAPTDESIKLYKEFVDKAKDNVLAAFSVKSNTLKDAVVVFHHSPDPHHMVHTLGYYVKFDLNGETIQFNGIVDPVEWRDDVIYPKDMNSMVGRAVRKIFEVLSEKIAQKLIEGQESRQFLGQNFR